ncbi:gamma carbonic anhydrase family protein [Nocardioides euryhalodurans]|uniref:Gamma carbonic anhydrase family protein n=1 Tax=Nocardioides euryhalodurans TaxID=2518370 RepID=A0A4P7GLD4_9ACTN|nr:gamma carbonic anhydrase family protein [Nocardioides euryhalodurans]QBR92850.1 gamma carbonic anhydrase family protein [Nocardioides euryhalodurans]
MSAPLLVPFGGATPEVHDGAFVAPGATLVGAVTLHDGSSVWYGAVLRADAEPITLGEGSNVQDGCVVHTDTGFPVTLGRDVNVGHGAVLHGCTIGDEVLVGMGSRILNGARIGDRCLVAAGAVVLEGADIPAGSLVAGVPAKVRRELTAEEADGLRDNAVLYHGLREQHREATSAP